MSQYAPIKQAEQYLSKYMKEKGLKKKKGWYYRYYQVKDKMYILMPNLKYGYLSIKIGQLNKEKTMYEDLHLFVIPESQSDFLTLMSILDK